MRDQANALGKEGRQICEDIFKLPFTEDNLLLILMGLDPNKPYEFPWQQSLWWGRSWKREVIFQPAPNTSSGQVGVSLCVWEEAHGQGTKSFAWLWFRVLVSEICLEVLQANGNLAAEVADRTRIRQCWANLRYMIKLPKNKISRSFSVIKYKIHFSKHCFTCLQCGRHCANRNGVDVKVTKILPTKNHSVVRGRVNN